MKNFISYNTQKYDKNNINGQNQTNTSNSNPNSNSITIANQLNGSNESDGKLNFEKRRGNHEKFTESNRSNNSLMVEESIPTSSKLNGSNALEASYSSQLSSRSSTPVSPISGNSSVYIPSSISSQRSFLGSKLSPLYNSIQSQNQNIDAINNSTLDASLKMKSHLTNSNFNSMNNGNESGRSSIFNNINRSYQNSNPNDGSTKHSIENDSRLNNNQNLNLSNSLTSTHQSSDSHISNLTDKSNLNPIDESPIRHRNRNNHLSNQITIQTSEDALNNKLIDTSSISTPNPRREDFIQTPDGKDLDDSQLIHTQTRKKLENMHQLQLDEMQMHLKQHQYSENPQRELEYPISPIQQRSLKSNDGLSRGNRFKMNITFKTLIYFSLFCYILGRFKFSISWILLLFLAIWTMYITRVNYFTPLYSILRSMNLNFWEGDNLKPNILTPEGRKRSKSLLHALGQRDIEERPDTQLLNFRQAVRRNLIESFNSTLSPQVESTLPKLSESALPLNFILSSLWATWDNTSLQNMINELLLENKSIYGSFIEHMEVTYVDVNPNPDSAPVVSDIRCVHATLESTVFELDVEYCGDFKMELFMRPKVIPLTLRCMVKEVVVQATIRLEIEYIRADNAVIGEFGEINISLVEYPKVLDASFQIFDSLVFNSIAGSIPAVTRLVKKQFDSFMSMIIYPKTFTLQENPARKYDPKESIPLHFGIVTRNMIEMEDLELEDEIKNVIMDINNLLKNTKLQGSNSDAVKKEVTQSVLQFLKYGTQPGRIPVSMMELIKRGFQILNQLAFEDQIVGEICLPVFEEIIRPENFELIGHVARVGTLADTLILNIMKLKNKEQQSQVNKTLEQLNMQDIIWTVLNRNSNPES